MECLAPRWREFHNNREQMKTQADVCDEKTQMLECCATINLIRN
jgi:hypothetical protein